MARNANLLETNIAFCCSNLRKAISNRIWPKYGITHCCYAISYLITNRNSIPLIKQEAKTYVQYIEAKTQHGRGDERTGVWGRRPLVILTAKNERKMST